MSHHYVAYDYNFSWRFNCLLQYIVTIFNDYHYNYGEDTATLLHSNNVTLPHSDAGVTLLHHSEENAKLLHSEAS